MCLNCAHTYFHPHYLVADFCLVIHPKNTLSFAETQVALLTQPFRFKFAVILNHQYYVFLCLIDSWVHRYIRYLRQVVQHPKIPTCGLVLLEDLSSDVIQECINGNNLEFVKIAILHDGLYTSGNLRVRIEAANSY